MTVRALVVLVLALAPLASCTERRPPRRQYEVEKAPPKKGPPQPKRHGGHEHKHGEHPHPRSPHHHHPHLHPHVDGPDGHHHPH